MRNDPTPDVSPDKSPHDRFTDLGKRLLAVPKSEVDKREADWKRKRTKSARKKR